MRLRTVFLSTVSTIVAVTLGASAAAPPASAAGGSTFLFSSAIQTSQTTSANSGTLTISTARPNTATLTIATNDGRPPQQIAVLIGPNNTLALDPSAGVAANPLGLSSAMQYLNDLTIVDYVGSATAWSQGSSQFTVQSVPVQPVGNGTIAQAGFTMVRSATALANSVYSGTSQIQTTTQLPTSGILSPAQLGIKTGGTGVLPDTVRLSVKVIPKNGQYVVSGVQTDTLALGPKAGSVRIVSRWSFST